MQNKDVPPVEKSLQIMEGNTTQMIQAPCLKKQGGFQKPHTKKNKKIQIQMGKTWESKLDGPSGSLTLRGTRYQVLVFVFVRWVRRFVFVKCVG